MVETKPNFRISVLHPQIKVVGGAMKQMLLVAELLSKNNNVSFYSFEGNVELESQNHSFSMKHSFSSYPLKLLSFFTIAWRVRHDDVIICGNSPTHFIAGISKIFFRSKAKTVWWNHHYPWYHENNTGITTYFKKLIETLIVSKIDTIVGNSGFLQEELKKIFQTDVECIYPMVDLHYFKKTNLVKQDSYKKRVFTAGRWELGKGLPDVLEIAKAVDVDIYIGGIGKELEKYQDELQRIRNIHLLGKLDVSQMKEQYTKADIFIFPSKIDSFGMVIIESLLCNIPVISYNRAEAKNIISHGENGFLVDTLEEMTNTINDYLKLGNHDSHIGQNLKKSFISNYSMKHFEKQWETIIFEK